MPDTAGGPQRLPMFPLQSVLVPAAPLPLHIFEPRYRALMDDVMNTAEPAFGVVLIERGSEVGGGDVRTRVGTLARVAEAEHLADGRWALVAVGARRIEVVEWLPDDPYPVAIVIDRTEGQWDQRSDELLAAVEPDVRDALALRAELGDRAVPATVELAGEPSTRAWQLVAIAPIPVIDRQTLLLIDDPASRLLRLRELVAEEAAVLAQRMRGL